jgi:uncharacterized protein (TIGR00290 family)
VNHRVAVSWSGGKDSALTVAELRASSEYEVVALFTNVDESSERVLAHRVRLSLLERQAAALDLPLHVVRMPSYPSNELFERKTLEALSELARTLKVSHVAFGDLFLEDIRTYRERLAALANLVPLFPLWRRRTDLLADEFIDQGFRAQLIAVDTTRLSPGFLGRDFDTSLLRDLPPGVDPCGEGGEFHTLVHDGPIFSRAIHLRELGRDLSDRRFAFRDVIEQSKTRLPESTGRDRGRPRARQLRSSERVAAYRAHPRRRERIGLCTRAFARPYALARPRARQLL